MDPCIESLQSTTFFGKRLARKQIAAIQEPAGRFPKLRRHELAHKFCEYKCVGGRCRPEPFETRSSAFALVSLSDDTVDVCRDEGFKLAGGHAGVPQWFCPDEFKQTLVGA